MEKEEIKKELHSMIDSIDSKEQLETIWLLMEPTTMYQTTNWYNELDEKDLARLNKSLEQADRGEFIDHETVKAKHAQWLK